MRFCRDESQCSLVSERPALIGAAPQPSAELDPAVALCRAERAAHLLRTAGERARVHAEVQSRLAAWSDPERRRELGIEARAARLALASEGCARLDMLGAIEKEAA